MHPQSKIRFSPILYQSPWSDSTRAIGQTILFGCPLELQTAWELPPVLEYLFESFYLATNFSITNSLHYDAQDSWSLVHEVELAWTGAEESDRVFISKYDPEIRHKLLCVGLLLSFTAAEGL